MGVNFLNISSFQKIHILCTFCAALYKSWNLPTYYFFISRCQNFNLRYIWKIIIFPFSKRKKKQFNLVEVKWKVKSFFRYQRSLKKRLRPRKIVFLFLLLSAFWWVGIVPIWLHYFPSAACDFRLFINEILSVIYIRSKSSVPCSFWLTILGAKIWKNAILGMPQDS